MAQAPQSSIMQTRADKRKYREWQHQKKGRYRNSDARNRYVCLYELDYQLHGWWEWLRLMDIEPIRLARIDLNEAGIRANIHA